MYIFTNKIKDLEKKCMDLRKNYIYTKKSRSTKTPQKLKGALVYEFRWRWHRLVAVRWSGGGGVGWTMVWCGRKVAEGYGGDDAFVVIGIVVVRFW